MQKGRRLARGLAWFGIGLCLVEVLAPRRLFRLIGLEHRAGLLRLFGLREIAAGAAILARPERPAPGVWPRVSGDALDLAVLASALGSRGRPREAPWSPPRECSASRHSTCAARQLGAPALAARVAPPGATPAVSAREDLVDESLEESFPASDVPAHQITGASNRRR